MKNKQDDGKISAVLLAIRRMERISGINALTFSELTAKSGVKTLLTAYNQGSITEAVINEPIPGLKGAWEFNYSQLSTLVQGRSNLEFTFNEGRLTIATKRYQVNVLGVEVANVQRANPPENPQHSFEINQDLWDLLKKSTDKVQLPKSLASLPDLDVHFSFNKDRILVASYDGYQTAYLKSKNKLGSTLELSLPLPQAVSLFKEYIGNALLKTTPEYLFLQIGNVRSLTPMVALSDENLAFSNVGPKLLAMDELKLEKTVSVSKESLAAFLNNAKAFLKSSSVVNCQVKDDSLTMTLSADGNSVEAKLKAKAKGKFNFLVDASYLSSIVSKAEDTISFSLDDTIIRFKSGTFTYVATLSVPSDTQ
jgi:DNA polymerase III sliding clamp (beta) subunit (PCNA family)